MPKKARKGNKTQVSQRQRLAALLISVGLSQSEAAKIVGVRPEQVTRWKRDEGFRDYLDKKIAEVESKVKGARDILIEAAPFAALKVMGLLESENEAILLRASGDILDRVGIAKTAKVETTETVGLTKEVLDALIGRQSERLKQAGEGRTAQPPDSD